MLPVLGALIGAGGSIAGGLIGAGAQEEANQMNWQINLLNYYQRQQERRDRIREAERTRADQRLGATDANGNRVRFVEGKGWVTELSGEDKTIQDLQRKEQLNVLQQDLPMRRAQMQRNDANQREEDAMAETFRQQLRTDLGVDPEALKRRMITEAAGAINREYDSLENDTMRKALRTGSTNSGAIMLDLARDRMKSIAGAIATIPTQARQMANQENTANRNHLSNLYNMFASRAQQMPGVSYKPENVTGQADQMMANFANFGQQGNQIVDKAYSQPGGTLDYVRPNTGYGDAIASGSGALAAAFERMNGYNNRSSAMNNQGF